MYADYTDRPLTGLDMIDTQHQELIDRINRTAAKGINLS